MSQEGFKRKLSAILSADVVGYSRLMRDDEEATVRTLNTHKEMISTLVEQNHGRVVDSIGDNLLAEFGSVVDTVRCAVQIQEDLKLKNEELPDNRKMEFRIGINTGDVIQEGDRIYGDGINVAARIESLADAGGICMSRSVYDQVKRKLSLKYDYLGEHEVKNIDEPVRVYKVLMEPEEKEAIAEKDPTIPLQDKPSIAVLPFVNMSNDPEQEYFSDGMTEELIGALAKLEGLKVISRTSAFFFKGKDVKLRQVGEELGVNNVLEGSVRKAGNRLRISAQLIRVDDDIHLWAENYNSELKDVFDIQEEISQAIVNELKIRILGKEKEPIIKAHTTNMDAYESFIKGRYFFYSFMEGGMEKALRYYKQALTLDPNYAPAYSAIAEWYWILPFAGGYGLSRDDVYTEAKKAINKALEIDNNLAEAHATLGLIRMGYEWDWDGTKKSFQTALTLNPGSSKAHHDYAIFLQVTGNFDKSISEAQKAVELDPLSGNTHYVLGGCFLASGQLDQAVEKIRYAREIGVKHLHSFYSLISAYRGKGMLEEAMSETKKGLELFPREPQLLGHMSGIYALKGEKDKARAILDELLERSKKEYVSSLHIALLYADLGEIDQTFEYLEKGYEKREIEYGYIRLSPLFRALRTDPRFIALLKKIGLED